MRRPGPLQALRGLIAGLLTTFLALLFHVVGGGSVPEPLAIALSAAAVCWVAVLVGRARASLPLLATSIALAQVVLHTAFSLTTAAATISTHSYAHHDAVSVVVSGTGHAMWLAHVLAGIATVAAVRRGERVLARLVELARMCARAFLRYVVRVLAVCPCPATRRVARAEVRVPAFVTAALGSVLLTRGPPVLAL